MLRTANRREHQLSTVLTFYIRLNPSLCQLFESSALRSQTQQ